MLICIKKIKRSEKNALWNCAKRTENPAAVKKNGGGISIFPESWYDTENSLFRREEKRLNRTAGILRRKPKARRGEEYHVGAGAFRK